LIEEQSVLSSERFRTTTIEVEKRLESIERRLDKIGLIEQRPGLIEQRLDQIAAIDERLDDIVCSQLERRARLLKSETAQVLDASKSGLDSLSEWHLDRWKFQEYEGLLRFIRRQEYDREIDSGRLAVPLLETDHPIAVSSNDTKFPRGSKNDNSIAPRFNHKLYGFLGQRQRLRVLDLGCAGGGFVRSLIDDGHFAVGLEGSDYPVLNQASEWSTIQDHLFTCDITKPFKLTDRKTKERLFFDAITAWEVMEHIAEDDLPALFENVDSHLAPGGYLIFSVATFLDWDSRTGCVWHVTVKPRSWWEEKFASLGFLVEDRHPFGKDDWLRGSGQCRDDWHEDQGLGFHVVLRRKAESAVAAETSAEWRELVA
jgi:2-polyprenyl-3-methyl-5-hydroxy-6-metoxy-1,4-benzoquinol methylase